MKYTLLFFILFPLFIHSQSIKLLRYSTVGYADGETISFTSISEILQYPGDLDESLIDGEYLGNVQVENDNYHEISGSRRARILALAGILETDTLFMFSFDLDTVLAQPVTKTPLVAFINIYGTNEPIPESDYMIAFEWSKDLFKVLKYSNTLVVASAKNPFSKRDLFPIRWRPIDQSAFPEVPLTGEFMEWYTPNDSAPTYTFEWKNYIYYVKAETHGHRHVVVQTKGPKPITVLNKVYFDSEGTYPEPLNDVHDMHGHSPFQYSGILLNDYPPIIIGFLSYSFGCSGIDFLSTPTQSLRIYCDNRH